jgi:hypothetical protein
MAHRRLNFAQRVVAVVAFGFVLYVLGAWIASLGEHLPYGSATYSNVSYSNLVGGLYPWVRYTVWLVLLAIWGGVSTSLLRDRPINQESRLSS